jgi:hypothetical protein
MTTSSYNNDDTSQVGVWEQLAYAPTAGDCNRDCTPSVYTLSPDRILGERSTPSPQSQTGKPGFLDEAEWDGRVDDEHALHYLIEWKVTLNNRVLAKDTEQDLVLKPSSYWEEIKQKAENVLHRKISRSRRVRSDDTTIVVSVKDRSQRDLTKRFEKTS